MNPGDYDDNGFLGERIHAWSERHREKYRAAFALTMQLNRECHAFISERRVDISNSYQLTTAVLFARLMEIYQGVVISVDRGLRSPTRILFRSFLEAFFHFAAIHKDKDYLDRYLDQFERHRKDLVNRIRKSSEASLSGLREAITPKIAQEVDEIDVASLTIKQVSQIAGWHHVYLSVYALLSRTAHCSPADLEDHVLYDLEKDEIAGFRYGPTDGETLRTLCLAGMTMSDGLRDISQDFAEDRGCLCAQLHGSFKAELEG